MVTVRSLITLTAIPRVSAKHETFLYPADMLPSYLGSQGKVWSNPLHIREHVKQQYFQSTGKTLKKYILAKCMKYSLTLSMCYLLYLSSQEKFYQILYTPENTIILTSRLCMHTSIYYGIGLVIEWWWWSMATLGLLLVDLQSDNKLLNRLCRTQ